MATTIIQKIAFRGATVQELWDLYTNQKKHTLCTGAEAVIQPKTDTAFSAYDGYATGKNLKLVKHQFLVQSWRASDWDEDCPDSLLVLYFEQQAVQALVHMVHSCVPDEQSASLADGWHEFYWTPWKAYLSKVREKA